MMLKIYKLKYDLIKIAEIKNEMYFVLFPFGIYTQFQNITNFQIISLIFQRIFNYRN